MGTVKVLFVLYACLQRSKRGTKTCTFGKPWRSLRSGTGKTRSWRSLRMRPMHRAPELAHICKINDWFFLKLEALSMKVSYVRFAVLGAWYEKENDTAFDTTPVERTKAFLEMRSYCGVVGKKIALSAGKHGEDTFHQFSIRFNQWIQNNPAVLQQKWLYQAEVSSFNHASYTLAGAFTVAYIALGMVLLGWAWYLNAFPF